MYQSMEAKFEGCELKHIGRASNEEADALANIGSTCSSIPDGVFYEVITQRTIKVKTSAPPKKLAADLGAAPQNDVEEITSGPKQQVSSPRAFVDWAFFGVLNGAAAAGWSNGS